MKHTVKIEDADDYVISQQIASCQGAGENKRLWVEVLLLAQTFQYIVLGSYGGERQELKFDTLPEAIQAYNEL